MAFFKWLEFKMREVKKWTFKLTISYTFYHLPMFRNQIWGVLKPIFVH
jgi:hypothetical protein